MATPAKPTPRSTRSKASRPETQPLAPYLAELLNPALNEPGGVDEAPATFAVGPRGIAGSAATAGTLQELLDKGDPNIRDRPPWTPHRPVRPQKSEGGRKFKIVSEYSPKGDQPEAIRQL